MKSSVQIFNPGIGSIVTRNRDFLADADVVKKRVAIEPIPGLNIWTDDFNNLFQILK